MRRLILLLVAIAASGPGPAHAERLFTDGFDPCCALGGEASGLAPGSAATLRLAAGTVNENLSIRANAPWQFAAPVMPGAAFTISVAAQPQGQTCSVTPATGSMGNAPDFGIVLTCRANLLWDSGNWGGNWAKGD